MLAQATLVAFVATTVPERPRAFHGGTPGLRLVSEDPDGNPLSVAQP